MFAKTLVIFHIHRLQSKKTDHTEYGLSVAAEEGFEPSQTESESVVLPLHNSAIY